MLRGDLSQIRVGRNVIIESGAVVRPAFSRPLPGAQQQTGFVIINILYLFYLLFLVIINRLQLVIVFTLARMLLLWRIRFVETNDK
jgi:hypothetical protein